MDAAMLRATTLLAMATAFEVGAHPRYGRPVTVEARHRRADDGHIEIHWWAVYWCGLVWERSEDFQGFIYEPGAGNRSDAFLAGTRHDFQTAMQIAEAIVAGTLDGTEHATPNRHFISAEDAEG